MAIPVRVYLLVGFRIIILRAWKLVFFSSLLFLILCSLGTWQIFRLGQKQTLLTQVNAGINAHPQQLSTLGPPEAFTMVTVSGHFLKTPPFLIKSKPFEGKVGQYVLAPFETLTHGTILVLQGWTKEGEGIRLTGQPMTLEGQIRYPATKSWFHPDNTSGNWYRIDPEAMGKAINTQLQPYYILESHPPSPILPLPKKPHIANNHIAYIITWFSLAFALCVIVIIYLRKESQRGGSNHNPR